MDSLVYSTLTQLANLLFPYRGIVFLAILGMLSLLGYHLQQPEIAPNDDRLIGYFLGLIWLLLLNTLLHIFHQPKPVSISRHFLVRLKQGFLRYCQTILVFLFIVISTIALYLSVKLVTL
tara:strand:- start:9 stop:368 length:360 start_codon:yes stop_codon:yes gene_type:complete